jgi:hypothetical protein
LSAAISSGFGAWANEATGTRPAMISLTRSPASGASARRFTPNGALVRPAVSAMAASSSPRLMVADAISPRPPAFDVAAASRGPDTYPIAACTTGCRMPSNSVSLVRITAAHPPGPCRHRAGCGSG